MSEEESLGDRRAELELEALDVFHLRCDRLHVVLDCVERRWFVRNLARAAALLLGGTTVLRILHVVFRFVDF